MAQVCAAAVAVACTSVLVKAPSRAYPMAPGPIGAENEGQPVLLSNLLSPAKRGSPQQAHT